jgi:hypothetical protein
MARYLIRALRQLQVGDSLRQPGELVPEAASWPNLRSYESLSWVERVPVPNDYSGEGAIEYPPAAPTSRLAKILEPEREPTPVVVAGKRRTKGSQPTRCVNCRKSNYLPTNFPETRTWTCWDCVQPQSIAQVREHPSPTSLAEYAESLDARYVDEAGDLKHDQWLQRGSEDVTAQFKQRVGSR